MALEADKYIPVLAYGGVIDSGAEISLTSAHILVGGSGGAAADVAMSGDATIANTGAVTVVKINGATLGTATATSGNLLIGSGTAWVTNAITGDVTLSSSGVTVVAKINGATLGTATATAGNLLVGSGTAWVSVVVSGDATLASTGALTTTKLAGAPKRTQATPTAKTVSATLTAAEVLAGIITVNQAGAAVSAQQLPTVADLETALTGEANDDAFDFSVINTSTVDAEDASITTNTGWTLVGSMDIHAYSAAGSLNSSALFRARKTGSGTWTLYRIS